MLYSEAARRERETLIVGHRRDVGHRCREACSVISSLTIIMIIIIIIMIMIMVMMMIIIIISTIVMMLLLDTGVAKHAQLLSCGNKRDITSTYHRQRIRYD